MQDPLYRGGTTKSQERRKQVLIRLEVLTRVEQMVKYLEKNNRCSRGNLSQHFTQERTSGRKKNTQTIYNDGSTSEKQNRDPYIFKKTWRSIADFIWSILKNGSVLHKKISWLVLESDFESDIKSKNNLRSMQYLGIDIISKKTSLSIQCLGIDIISKKTSLSILCLWTDIQEDFVIDSVTWDRTSKSRRLRDQICAWGSTSFPRRLRDQFCALGSDIISKKTSWSILCLRIVHHNQEDFVIYYVPWDRTALPRRRRDQFCIMEPNLLSKKILWTLTIWTLRQFEKSRAWIMA